MTKHLYSLRAKIGGKLPRMPEAVITRFTEVVDRVAGEALAKGSLDEEILVEVVAAVVEDIRAQKKQLLGEIEWMLDNRRAPNVFHEIQHTVQKAFEEDERWYNDMEHTR